MSYRLPEIPVELEFKLEFFHLALAAAEAAVAMKNAEGDHADLVRIIEKYEARRVAQ